MIHHNRRAFAGLGRLFPVAAGGDSPGLAIHRDDMADYRPRDFAIDVIRTLAADYHEACRRNDAAWRMLHDKTFGKEHDRPCPWQGWVDIVHYAKLKAEERLIEAILLLFGKDDRDAPDRDTSWTREWDPCSFELDGRIYVVSQRSGCEDHRDPVLTVLDVALHTDADWSDD